jgi:hypothetical protein
LRIAEAIPPAVFKQLSARVREAGNSAHAGYEDFQEEEDALTGDLGAQIRNATNGIQVVDPATLVEWTVRTRLKKFRGRGDGALEKPTGADGIIQVEVLDTQGNVASAKGMLFQAKKGHARLADRGLVEQAEAMEDLVPGASAVFEYSEHRYSAVTTRKFLEAVHNRNSRNAVLEKSGLGDFLADNFLACHVGLGGLYYDSHRRRLVAPDTAGGRVVTYRVDRRFFITVTPRDKVHMVTNDD